MSLSAVKKDEALDGVEVGNGPKEPRLAGPRSTFHRQAFAVRNLERERRQRRKSQCFDAQHEPVILRTMCSPR
jgi:hypothetical protein